MLENSKLNLNCHFHRKTIANYICLDSECQKARITCFDCIKQDHYSHIMNVYNFEDLPILNTHIQMIQVKMKETIEHIKTSFKIIEEVLNKMIQELSSITMLTQINIYLTTLKIKKQTDSYYEDLNIIIADLIRLQNNLEQNEKIQLKDNNINSIKIKHEKNQNMHFERTLNEEMNYIFEKGIQLVNQKKYSEALIHCKFILKQKPNFITGYLLQGDILMLQQNYRQANETYDKALQIDPKDVDLLNQKGLALCWLNDFESALNCFDFALLFEPKNIKILLNKVQTLFRLKLYQESLICMDEIIKNDSFNVDNIIKKAQMLIELNLLEQAVQTYNHSLDISQNNIDALIGKGVALLILNQYQEALTNFNHALSIDQDNMQALYNKGFTLNKLCQFEESIECFSRILLINPHNSHVQYLKIKQQKVRLIQNCTKKRISIQQPAFTVNIRLSLENTNQALVNYYQENQDQNICNFDPCVKKYEVDLQGADKVYRIKENDFPQKKIK